MPTPGPGRALETGRRGPCPHPECLHRQRPRSSAPNLSRPCLSAGIGNLPKAPVRFPPLGDCYNYWVSSWNASEVSDVIQTFPPSLVYFCPISIQHGRGSVKEAWKQESWMSLGSAAPSSPAPTMTQRVLRPTWCKQAARSQACRD